MIVLCANQVDDNTQFCGRAQLAPTFSQWYFGRIWNPPLRFAKPLPSKKTIEFTSKQGLRTRNVWLAKRFDEKNASKGRVIANEHTWRVCDWAKHGWLRSIVPSKDTQDLWASPKKSKIPLGKPKGIFYRWFVMCLRYFAKLVAKKFLLVTKIFFCNKQFFPQNSQSDWQK